MYVYANELFTLARLSRQLYMTHMARYIDSSTGVTVFLSYTRQPHTSTLLLVARALHAVLF
jgi:hypothetical protein